MHIHLRRLKYWGDEILQASVETLFVNRNAHCTADSPCAQEWVNVWLVPVWPRAASTVFVSPLTSMSATIQVLLSLTCVIGKGGEGIVLLNVTQSSLKYGPRWTSFARKENLKKKRKNEWIYNFIQKQCELPIYIGMTHKENAHCTDGGSGS